MKIRRGQIGYVSPLKGKNRPPFDEVWKSKMAKSKTGKRWTEESRLKMSKTRTGKKHSFETKLKMVKSAPRGENRWNWRGGVRNLHEQIRILFEYRQWRSDVFTRDKYICVHCGQKGGYLEADHINPLVIILRTNNIINVEDAKNCSELWDINNVRTLCKKCHIKTDTFGYKINKKING